MERTRASSDSTASTRTHHKKKRAHTHIQKNIENVTKMSPASHNSVCERDSCGHYTQCTGAVIRRGYNVFTEWYLCAAGCALPPAIEPVSACVCASDADNKRARDTRISQLCDPALVSASTLLRPTRKHIGLNEFWTKIACVACARIAFHWMSCVCRHPHIYNHT